MEDSEPQAFKNFIFQEAWNAIPVTYEEIMKLYDCDWQLYQDSEKEKLEWIDSTLKEMRENLVLSQFKVPFPLNVIKNNLSTTLKDYCNSLPIYLSEDPRYLGFDGYVDNVFGSIIVRKDNYKALFSSVQCEFLKPLIYHLALYQIYIEFKRRKAEILEKPTIHQPGTLAEKPLMETDVEEEYDSCNPVFKEIFKDRKALNIFQYLQDNLVGVKTALADYSFIFRGMQKDGYIFEHIKEKDFRRFLSRHFDIQLNSKLKPFSYGVTELKEKVYGHAIHSSS